MSSRSEIHQRIFYCGLLLIVFTLPYSLLANSISIIILCINWLVEGKYAEKLKLAKNNNFLFFFIFFYLLHVLGILYTSNVNAGLFDLQRKLSLFILPIIIATSGKLNHAQIKNILKVFFISILAASFICLGYAGYRTDFLRTYSHPYWLYFSYTDLTSILKIQPTYLAIYVCFSIFILFYFLIENYSSYGRYKRTMFFCLILYLVIFLFLIASKTAIIALLIILFSGIVYYYYKIHKLLKGIFVIGIISTFFVIALFQFPLIAERFLQILGIEHQNVWINQYGDGSGKVPDARMLKWKCAWNVIKENWLLGVGTGDDQEALQIQYKNINFQEAFNAEYNAHNQYLQTWLGLGILGLISLLVCLVAQTVIAFRKRSYLYISFIALIIISCIPESMFCRQQGIVFYSLFASLFAFSGSNT